jgi:hypothetical protein
VFGGVLLFHPGWVVSSALAGLASGFGMGPGVSLPLLTAVTLVTFSVFPLVVVGEGVRWCWGAVCGWVWIVGVVAGFFPLVVGKFSAG